MPKLLPEFPLPQEASMLHSVDLDTLPPRMLRLMDMLLRHQAVLCACNTGAVAITLHFHGAEVKPQLEIKLALNSWREDQIV